MELTVRSVGETRSSFIHSVAGCLAVGLVILFGLGTIAAFALGEFVRGAGFLFTLLFVGGIFALAPIASSKFRSSRDLDLEARERLRLALAAFWVGGLGQLALDLLRWFQGTAEFFEDGYIDRHSFPSYFHLATTCVLVGVSALAFAAERHRADGDTLGWPRWPNYAPDAIVYRPRGRLYRRVAYCVLQPLWIGAVLMLVYLLVR